jgi:putative tryptophan/tyrosine transport system substrate-binding protein
MIRLRSSSFGATRREFVAALGGTLASWPLAARGQQGTMPVIGAVGSANAKVWEPYVAAWRKGLAEAGFIEGRNVQVEYRWADGQYERLPGLAEDLIGRKVVMLAAFSTPAALAVKAATGSIPIVFTIITDPVRAGLVSNLSRPGGNITGISYLNVEVGPKLLEIMHEAVPAAKTIALLVNPANPGTATVERNMQAAADKLGVTLPVLHVDHERQLDAAFARLAELRPGGLVIGGDVVLNAQMATIAATALRLGLPTIYPSERFAALGGLMSYAGSALDGYQRAGGYAGRILRGDKPADLPVQLVSKIEFVINMKTAKALGITMPLSLLGRADQVIE